MFARNFLRNMTGRMSRVASATQKRHGGGGSHHGPNKWAAANKEFGIELHEPAMMHKASANFLLLVCWVWVMYRIKEDKGKMMGWHQPWLEPHEHEEYEWVTVEQEESEESDAMFD